MSNELAVGHLQGKTVYAIVRRQSNAYIWDVGDSALEAIGTWNDARVDECDIALTDKGGGMYAADFPSACTTAATYLIFFFEQAGGSPDTTDRLVGRATITWNGSSATTTPGSGSGKTLTNLKTICQYHGWSDLTTAGGNELTNFINFTLSMLSQLAPWPEYMKVDGSHTFDAADDHETLDESSIIRVGNVIRSNKATPLDEISLEEYLFKAKYHAGSGPPNEYALRRDVSSGLITMDMYLYPKPAVETTLYYPYQIAPAVLSDGTDETDWPIDRIWLLTDALKIRLAATDRDSGGMALYSADFMTKVNRAFNAARPSFMPVIAKPLELVRPGKQRLQDTEKTITS